MSKLIKSELQDELNFIVSYQVDKEEYQNFKERIVDQLLKNVEVPGFRKGKAPHHLAMQKVDQARMETMVYQETIYKFYPEIEAEAKKELAKLNRFPVSAPAQVNPQSIEENDEGFRFDIIFALLPNVDIEPIRNLEVKKVQLDEIPGRLSLEEFKDTEKKKFISAYNEYEEAQEESAGPNHQIVANIFEKAADKDTDFKETKEGLITLGIGQFPDAFEKELIGIKAGETREFQIELQNADGLTSTFDFKIECLKVLKAKFDDLEAVLEHSTVAASQFKSAQEFETFLDDIYNQESESILTDMQRKLILQSVVKAVPEFALPHDKIQAEIDRIVGVLEERKKDGDQDLETLFQESGIPGNDKPVKSFDDIKKRVEDYVHSEFKLVGLVEFIYETQVERKITEADIKSAKEEIKSNPARFRIYKQMSDEELHNTAFDRLVRSAAYNWIFETVKVVDTENSATKKSAKKSESVETKTEDEPKQAKKAKTKKAE